MSDELTLVSQEGIEKQNPYVPASDVCDGLNTLVPQAMAHESKNWNLSLATKIGMPVDDYVMGKLKYTDYEEFCKAFAKEQVDAIATSIYNFEATGNGIILADATGVGKGRVVAGLLRYAVMNLGVVPMFFTDKINLINDIYRDMVDIKWDTAVPMSFKKKVEIEAKEYTDEEIYSIISEDIANDEGEFRVGFELPEKSNGEPINPSDIFNEEYSDYLEELIDLYREFLTEDGNFSVVYEKNINYEKQVYMAEKMGRTRVLPFIPKKPPEPVKDKMGNILYELKGSDIDKIIKSGNLPEEYKVICAPYSQVSKIYDKDGNLTDKAKFWLKYSNNTVIILDESHNAAGSKEGANQKQSNTFLMVSKMLNNCRYATYVSATFAKRPESMPIYSIKTSLSELNMPLEAVIKAFKIGGLPIQEATSAQLVRIGQLVRREKEITGITEYFYASLDSPDDRVSAIAQDQIIKLDRVSKSFTKILEFGEKVKNAFQVAKKATSDESRYSFSGKVERSAFLLFNFLLLGIKTRQTYEHAIKQLSNGKKVVIAIANTMESAFDNMRKDFIKNEKFELGDVIENDFSLYCAYLLSSTTYFSFKKRVVDNKGKIKLVPVKINVREFNKIQGIDDDFDDEIRRVAESIYYSIIDDFKKILDELLDNKIGAPLSPIDIIKSSISEAGFTVDEVTGRGRNLVFSKDNIGQYDFKQGRIEKRIKGKKDEIFRRFQENELDCIILNQTGAVGASLHAIPTFNEIGEIVQPVNVIKDIDIKDITKRVAPTSLLPKNEVKQRYMIITQMEYDVNKEVQKLGRIDRTGQVLPPMYGYLISAVPSESRLSAMMERKLRSLSANTSANQNQAEDLYSSDDFFSNEAVKPFNDTMVEIEEKGTVAKDGVNHNQQNIVIYNYTKKLYFSNYDRQLIFYQTFSKNLNAHISQLKQDNCYTAKMQIMDYKAKQLSVKPLIIGNNGSLSPFGRHAFIDESRVFVYLKKVRETEIEEKINLYLNFDDDNNSTISFSEVKEYSSAWKNWTDKYLKKSREDSDLQISAHEKQLSEFNKKIIDLNKELKQYEFLDKAIEIVESISQKKKELDVLSERGKLLMTEGTLEEVSKVMLEVQQIQKELDTLQKTFNENPSYQEIILNTERPNYIYREMSRLQRDIEKSERDIKNINELHEKNVTNISIFHDYILRIGYIQKMTRVANPITDENGKYEYALATKDEPVVITSVQYIGAWYENFNLSNILVGYATVTEFSKIPLSQVESILTEEQIAMGVMNLTTFVKTDKKYIKNWTDYIKNVDTGTSTEKVFISGNLLKAFGTVLQGIGDSPTASRAGGQVVKYTTDDGKVRIGYELTKSSAEQFKKVFVEESVYSIYYDLTYENFEILTLDLFKKNALEYKYSDRARTQVYMQLFSISEKNVFIKLSLNNHYNAIDDNYYLDDSNINVSILSDKQIVTDAFISMMKQSGVDASEIIYETSKPETQTSRIDQIIINRAIDKSDFQILNKYAILNKNLFCNYSFASDLQLGKGKLTYSYILKFSLYNLRKLLDYMLSDKKVFVGITSSQAVEENKDFYVFEQYADEVADVTSQGVQDPTDSLKEIDDAINYLVSLLR
jgi:hypothetical protein